MKIYYAHAMCLYRRPEERRQMMQIREQFRRCRVVNPARYDGHPQKQEDTVGFCLKLIDRCDAVVFSKLLGKITAGVGKEINHALKTGKPVFEVLPDRIVPRKQRVKYISRLATVRLYGRYRLQLWNGLNRD